MRPFCSMRMFALAFACLAATGCRHKTAVVVVPPLPPPTTVPLDKAPESTTPRLPQQPVSPAPLPTQPVQPKVKKPRKKPDAAPAVAAPVAAPVAGPTVVASVTPAADASVIGALSAGGDATPAQRQKALDAMNDVEKRLSALSTDTLKNQDKGIAQVKNFLRQAHDSLNSGDAEGAITLATKAQVLLEDLLK